MKTRDLLKYINIRLVVQYRAIEDIPRKTRNRNNAQHEQDVEKDGPGWVSSLVDERRRRRGGRATRQRTALLRKPAWTDSRGGAASSGRRSSSPGRDAEATGGPVTGAGVRSHSCSLRTDHRGIPRSRPRSGTGAWSGSVCRHLDRTRHDLVRCSGIGRSTGRARSGRTAAPACSGNPGSRANLQEVRGEVPLAVQLGEELHPLLFGGFLVGDDLLEFGAELLQLVRVGGRVGEGSVQLLLSVVELRNGPLEL